MSGFPVQTFERDGVAIRVYNVDGEFVAADQAGWLPGCWATVDEAMAAAKEANGLGSGTGMDENEHIVKGAALLQKALEDAVADGKVVFFGHTMYVDGVPDPDNIYPASDTTEEE